MADRQESLSSSPLSTAYKTEQSNVLLPVHEEIEMQSINNNSGVSPEQHSFPILPDCCPQMISKNLSCCAKCIPQSIEDGWMRLRDRAHQLAEHRFFELFIIFSIIVSSITLVSRC